MNFIETEIYSHLALVAHKYEYMSVNTHETTEHAPVCSGMLGMGSAEHTPVLDMRRAKYALVLGCWAWGVQNMPSTHTPLPLF